MTHPETIMNHFHQCQYWTTLDLANAFYQIQVHPDYTHKLAFTTGDVLYEFLVMPFGIKNAPATFQYLMYLVLGKFYGKFVFVYLDDIIIYLKTKEEHMQHLHEVLTEIRKAGLKIKPAKCQ